MTNHFNTRNAAVHHLVTKGFTELANGRWVSRDRSVAAHILTAHGEVVAVQFWEIETA